MGHNGTAYRNQETGRFVKRLMAANGVVPAHSGELLLRKRAAAPKSGERMAAWIVTNPTEKDITENLGVAGWSDVSDLFGEKLAIEDGSVAITVGSLDVRVLFLRRPGLQVSQSSPT